MIGRNKAASPLPGRDPGFSLLLQLFGIIIHQETEPKKHKKKLTDSCTQKGDFTFVDIQSTMREKTEGRSDSETAALGNYQAENLVQSSNEGRLW